jgi:nicotinamide-nucleotide amidase
LKIEIINTGSELILGHVLNTHQQWLCRELGNLGFRVERQTLVADASRAIQQTVQESMARADVILTTGGLGPTSDDMTRDLIAEMLGRKLIEDPAVLENIEKFFVTRHRTMTTRSRLQAQVPEGAQVIPNRHGTAPGLALEVDPNPFRPGGKKSLLIMLPGPPRELHPMFSDQVVPLLKKFSNVPEIFSSVVLKTTGLGESIVEEKISAPLNSFVERGLEIGYCARVGEVEVRLSAKGVDASTIVSDAEKQVRDEIGAHIFGAGGDTLESVVVRLCREQKKTLALAESCTGGLIAHRITNVPGASEIFLHGVVSYSNEAKKKLLGVRGETLEKFGAVSQEVAAEMAQGARAGIGADFALAVTGIAGPTGGTANKPVGTVFIALAGGRQTLVQQHLNSYDRETFKFVTSQQALNLLREKLLEAGV